MGELSIPSVVAMRNDHDSLHSKHISLCNEHDNFFRNHASINAAIEALSKRIDNIVKKNNLKE